MWTEAGSSSSEINGAGVTGSTELPTFDCFLWPVIEVMKSRVGEWGRAQVVESAIEHPSIGLSPAELSENDEQELRYRAARAFDLLVVAEVVEERFGNLFALGAGALVLTEEEALTIPRRIRTLDSYFHRGEDQSSDESLLGRETKKSIARKTVKFLRDESLNELQLKEKLVKDFVDRRGLGKNLKVINAYLKKAEYVKMVLESEDVVSCKEDGTIELSEDSQTAREVLEEHYEHPAWNLITSRLRRYFFRVRTAARDHMGRRYAGRVAFDILAVLSIIGLSWLVADRINRHRK
ncbi:MAG: hypothetical protein H6677_27680 [Candidatus Obscuribacterales bacterium]|nr:hypothetical protein [Candidatus Obscuribacterales bacterium]